MMEKTGMLVSYVKLTLVQMLVQILVNGSSYSYLGISDILVMLVYWKIDQESWAALTLTFLIFPAVVMQASEINCIEKFESTKKDIFF